MIGAARANRFLPAAALAIGACVLVYPVVLFGQLPDHYDFWLQEYVHLVVLARALASAELPLWNPLLAGGTPHLADPQTAVYYPLTTPPLLILSPPAVERISIPFHYALAGCGVFMLARALGASRPAALAGGVAYMLAPHFALIELPTYLQQSAAWAPWVLWALHRAFERGSITAFTLAGALWAIQWYRGYPQTWYFTGLLVAGYAAFRLGALRGARLARGAAGVVAFGVAALSLAAAQLVPALDLLGLSHRAGPFDVVEAAGRGRISVYNLLGAAGPDAEVSGAFPGGAAVTLALAGLLFVPQAHTRFFAAAGAAGLLLCFGSAAPAWGVAYVVLPGFALWHMPHRALFIWSVALAVLGAYGVDALRARPPLGRLTVVVVALVAAAAAIASPGAGAPVEARAGAAHLGAGAGLTLAAAWLVRLGGRRFAALVTTALPVVVGVDLLAHSLPRLEGRYYSPAAVYAAPEAARWLSTRATDGPVRFVSAARGPFAGGLGDPKAPDSRRLAYLPPNSSLVFPGLDAFQGYLAIRLERTGELFDAINDVGRGSRLLSVYDARSPLLDELGVRYAVTDDVELPERFRVVHQAPGLRIWENTSARPLAHWRPDMAAAALAIERRAANAVDVRTSRATMASLVVNQTLAPGWRGFVDGRPVGIEMTEAAQIAVTVPGGAHRVGLRYLPASVVGGAGVAGAATAATAALALAALSGRRRSSRSSLAAP